MTSSADKSFANRLPNEAEIKNATLIKAIIAARFKEDEPTILPLATDGRNVESVALTPALAASLLELIGLVSSGRGFRVMPVESKFTTQKAADFLNVSRPFLLKLLEKGDIQFSQGERHRYIQANDLLAYKKKRDEERSKALDELMRIDQELGLI